MPNTPKFYFLFVKFLYQHAPTKQQYLEKSVISSLISDLSVLLAETGLEIPDFSFNSSQKNNVRVGIFKRNISQKTYILRL